MRSLFFVLLAATPALAHDGYTQWVSKAGKNCCNNQDCRPISDDDVQMTPVTKVRINGVWCDVLPVHYLQTGNAPDWSTAHVCISRQLPYPTYGWGVNASPCNRLLCFQPKPQY